MEVRRFASIAAPALAVGLLLVSQALTRVQASPAHPKHNHAASHHGRAVHSKATTSASNTVACNIRLVNTLLRRERILLNRGNNLFARQAAINARLAFLATQPRTPQLLALANRLLRQFNRLQNQINMNKALSAATFAAYTPRINQALANLAPFSNNPQVSAFINASQVRQQALQQELQTILNRPPATPAFP